ncbi:hypothetical protein NDU88_008855 [Pleurodeles waltl]|uniref:Uncharacterized protein n=1 Tax=Pleurodeles waltl TaxID=8319 RepID=A0AAV7RWZ0_PLEWA|nr:hypothetical protein NDU88_008855 [Pleurodeles waltl]
MSPGPLTSNREKKDASAPSREAPVLFSRPWPPSWFVRGSVLLRFCASKFEPQSGQPSTARPAASPHLQPLRWLGWGPSDLQDVPR